MLEMGGLASALAVIVGDCYTADEYDPLLSLLLLCFIRQNPAWGYASHVANTGGAVETKQDHWNARRRRNKVKAKHCGRWSSGVYDTGLDQIAIGMWNMPTKSSKD